MEWHMFQKIRIFQFQHCEYEMVFVGIGIGVVVNKDVRKFVICCGIHGFQKDIVTLQYFNRMLLTEC